MFQIRRNAYRSLSSPSRTLSSPQPQRKREAEPNDHDAALEHRRQHSENTGAVTRDEYPQAHRSLRLAFRDDGSPSSRSRLRNLSSTSDVVELRSPAKRARTPTAADYHNAPHDDGPFCPPATTAFPSRSRSMPSAAKTPVKSGEYVVGGVNVTAETAELSYDHEDNEGRCLPAFPVSSVKRHPAETSGEAWGSPPRSKEVRRRATLTRLLSDCHHQSVSPALSFISYLAAKRRTRIDLPGSPRRRRTRPRPRLPSTRLRASSRTPDPGRHRLWKPLRTRTTSSLDSTARASRRTSSITRLRSSRSTAGGRPRRPTARAA